MVERGWVLPEIQSLEGAEILGRVRFSTGYPQQIMHLRHPRVAAVACGDLLEGRGR
jgi:hypothetical protein